MAYHAVPGTFQHLGAPSLATTYSTPANQTVYPESINSTWTHPNPYVEQVGNHLIHKDSMPKNLRFNDQKRDKEVLDNLRNRVLRQRYGDSTPAISGPPVRPPPQTTPVSYDSTLTPGSVAATYTQALTPTYEAAATLYPDATISASTPLLALPTAGKPYSPLATPFHHSGLPYSGALVNPAYPQYHGLSNATMSYNLDRTYTPLAYTAATAAYASPAFASGTVYPSAATLTTPQTLTNAAALPAAASYTTPATYTTPVSFPMTTAASYSVPTSMPAAYTTPTTFGTAATYSLPISFPAASSYSVPAFGAPSAYSIPSTFVNGSAPIISIGLPATFGTYSSSNVFTSSAAFEQTTTSGALIPAPAPAPAPALAKATDAPSEASPPATTVATVPQTL